MEIVGVLASYINVDRIFLYLILLILFFGLAIVIERTIFFSRCKVDGTALLSSIHQALQSDNLEKAIAECNLSAAPLSHIFRKGLTQAIPPVRREAVQGAVDEALLEVLPRIEKRIDFLPTLANIATMLGLLGTLLGLISAFQAISIADPAHKATLFAKGISTAMYTTVIGLMVAIPFLFLHAILQSQTTALMDHLEEFSFKFVRAVSGKG